jgi:hypothetical protein
MAVTQKYIFSISCYSSNLGTIQGSNVKFCIEIDHKLVGNFVC